MSDVWRLLSPTSFFEKLCASESDWGSVLDAREDEGFDQLWTSHHAALLATPLTPEMTEGITRLREHAFKTASLPIAAVVTPASARSPAGRRRSS
ncbi:hypothetical protein [Pseudomonas syringae group genomosp. 3]|uniref:hypothetical protein n=1 Tax=Pseudomonas syringae group genomosp. 3 TaxID=251701 RepID=UPI0011C396D0|nr:hypothetical protein [Pseudomonas syringae group genomosp. 3]